MQIKKLLLVSLLVLIEEIFCDVSILAKFHLKDYKVKNIRTELLEYNKDLINFFEVKTFKELYRHFPIRVRLNACQVLAADVFGALSKLTVCGNTTRCFFAKDTTYHICNFTPLEEHLPPNMPTGEFMAEGEVFYLNVTLGKGRFYGEVYRPIYPKNRKG